MKTYYAPFILLSVLAGCFYPPIQKPLPARASRVTVALPYDLAWDAVHAVIGQNFYKIVTQNPDGGIVEAQAVGGFTLKDADCGELKGIAGRYLAEPDPNASAVYDFAIKPIGGEASIVSVQATFTAPLHVPLHPPSYEQCVSRGVQEARLLREISRQALREHRPSFAPRPSSPGES
jgi:hypothetical protein